MPSKLGLEAKVYRLTTGTRAAWPASGAPSNLSEITNVRDVTVSLTKSEADVTTRGSGGFRLTRGALKDASVSFEMVWDPADTHFAALQTAFFANTSVALAFLDGSSATVGSQGLWADFEVMEFEKSEPLEGAQMVSVTLKTTYSAVAPEWADVGS